jgi:RND superfamily putative drug exporter
VAAELRGQDGVASVAPPERRAGGWHELVAVTRDEENTPAARAVVRDTRGAFEERGLHETFVGGQTAEGMDLTDRIGARTPLVVGMAALICCLLLLVSFRSVVVPLKAVLTTLLSVGAALGLTTLLFEVAGGSEGLAHFVPPLLFAIAFGLSMDYEVFLLSRIREARLAGAPDDVAIERGLVRSGRPITLAALVMVVVFAAMATSRLEPFQQLGVGLAAAVLIDATIVRCALVPAAMAVMGRANWWMPGLRRGAGAPRRTATTTAR